MTQITFITPDGDAVVVSATSSSLMEAAVANAVDGIDADCGGVCSCATCHVHVEPRWLDTVGPASAIERTMLELEDKANSRSRLSCQVQINAALDGCVVRVVGR